MRAGPSGRPGRCGWPPPREREGARTRRRLAHVEQAMTGRRRRAMSMVRRRVRASSPIGLLHERMHHRHHHPQLGLPKCGGQSRRESTMRGPPAIWSQADSTPGVSVPTEHLHPGPLVPGGQRVRPGGGSQTFLPIGESEALGHHPDHGGGPRRSPGDSGPGSRGRSRSDLARRMVTPSRDGWGRPLHILVRAVRRPRCGGPRGPPPPR